MAKPKPLPEVKPCPFCGSKRVEVTWGDFVKCHACQATGPERKTDRGIILAWNRAKR